MTIFEVGTNPKYLDEMPNLSNAALSAMADGVVIIDSNGLIKWVNSAYEDLTGYSLDEFINKNINFLKSEKQNSELYNDLWTVIQTGNTWKGEIWNKRKNGEVYLEEQSITPVKDEQSRITHFVAVNRDITNKNKLNIQVNNAKRIEAIGQLTAGIAHNFNNKLASILGFSGLVLDELKEHENEDISDSINEIITAGKDARDLVQQMMAFSVTTLSDPRPVDIKLAIEQAVKTITSTLPAELQVFIELNEVPLVNIDPVRLHQMLISLAVNSSESMGKHGKLTFSLDVTHINNIICSSCHEIISGDYVFVSVKDTGKGIPETDIVNIFMPFFTTHHDKGGTGMGLSALHGMLHDMKGHILVDSVIDDYTEFKLLFPIDKVTEIKESVTQYSEHLEHKEVKRVKKLHILVVDDDKSVANFMFEMLSINGYEVTKETNSKEAFKLFSENPNKFDLLITDQSMPHLSGSELVKLVCDIREDLPVILMTGYGENELNDEAEHINAVLTKPFDTSELLDILNEF